jgi:hypothetical protein
VLGKIYPVLEASGLSDWMPGHVPGQGGRRAGQTVGEILPTHVYRSEEKCRCGLFPSLVLFLLVDPSSAMSGGAISSTGCVAPLLFAARGRWSHLDVWTITGGPQYLGYKTLTQGY